MANAPDVGKAALDFVSSFFRDDDAGLSESAQMTHFRHTAEEWQKTLNQRLKARLQTINNRFQSDKTAADYYGIPAANLENPHFKAKLYNQKKFEELEKFKNTEDYQQFVAKFGEQYTGGVLSAFTDKDFQVEVQREVDIPGKQVIEKTVGAFDQTDKYPAELGPDGKFHTYKYSEVIGDFTSPSYVGALNLSVDEGADDPFRQQTMEGARLAVDSISTLKSIKNNVGNLPPHLQKSRKVYEDKAKIDLANSLFDIRNSTTKLMDEELETLSVLAQGTGYKVAINKPGFGMQEGEIRASDYEVLKDMIPQTAMFMAQEINTIADNQLSMIEPIADMYDSDKLRKQINSWRERQIQRLEKGTEYVNALAANIEGKDPQNQRLVKAEKDYKEIEYDAKHREAMVKVLNAKDQLKIPTLRLMKEMENVDPIKFLMMFNIVQQPEFEKVMNDPESILKTAEVGSEGLVLKNLTRQMFEFPIGSKEYEIANNLVFEKVDNLRGILKDYNLALQTGDDEVIQQRLGQMTYTLMNLFDISDEFPFFFLAEKTNAFDISGSSEEDRAASALSDLYQSITSVLYKSPVSKDIVADSKETWVKAIRQKYLKEKQLLGGSVPPSRSYFELADDVFLLNMNNVEKWTRLSNELGISSLSLLKKEESTLMNLLKKLGGGLTSEEK